VYGFKVSALLFAFALLQRFCHRFKLLGGFEQQVARFSISHGVRERPQFFRTIEIVLDFLEAAGQFPPSSPLARL